MLLAENRFKYALIVSLGLLSLILPSGCDEPDFDLPWTINDFRILAIKADPAEAAPGDKVTITGLAVNEDGTKFEDLWVFILMSGLDFNADSDSEDVESGAYREEQIGYQERGAEAFVYTIPSPEKIKELYGYYNPEGTIITIGAGAALGAETVDDFEDGKGELDFAFKTFIISERPESERNTNPVFQEILVDQFGFEGAKGKDGHVLFNGNRDWRMVAKFDNLDENAAMYSWYAVGGASFEARSKVVEYNSCSSEKVDFVYVVARNNYLFESPLGFATRSTGLDWGQLIFDCPK